MTIRRRSVYADRLLAYHEFVFSDGAEFARRGGWREFFAARIGPTFDGRVIFEIGCNDALFLARVAAKHPTTAFIGIDWKCRAVHTAAERVAAAGLQNVALLHGRAQDICRIFAGAEVDEVWVFHPDPCDKPRELSNRLIAEPFLIDLYDVLPDRASLVLKTDHGGYYQYVLDLFHSNLSVIERYEVVLASSDFWSDAVARSHAAGCCFADEVTSFETRFIKKRQPICFMEIAKRPAAGSSGAMEVESRRAEGAPSP